MFLNVFDRRNLFGVLSSVDVSIDFNIFPEYILLSSKLALS